MTLRAVTCASVSTPEQAADEKESLVAQRRDLIAIVEQHNWVHVAHLEVPGFSRDYISFDDCERDMAAKSVFAFTQLRELIEKRAFDVFVVRDADRFGRTQSLVAQIAEWIVVIMGGTIYSQMDGLVDRQHVRGDSVTPCP
jgi:DNA invertase Pin-like site-specific DNA recombinase